MALKANALLQITLSLKLNCVLCTFSFTQIKAAVHFPNRLSFTKMVIKKKMVI